MLFRSKQEIGLAVESVTPPLSMPPDTRDIVDLARRTRTLRALGKTNRAATYVMRISDPRKQTWEFSVDSDHPFITKLIDGSTDPLARNVDEATRSDLQEGERLYRMFYTPTGMTAAVSPLDAYIQFWKDRGANIRRARLPEAATTL